MTRKYEITDMQNPENPNLFRIRALRDIPRFNVKAGDLGGYVQHEWNLSHEGDCWVGGDAQVYDGASVYGNAFVYGNAAVYGMAQISSNARVHDNAHVFGNSFVMATINENMVLLGSCCIGSRQQIYYVDGVTAYFDFYNKLIIIGTTTEIAHHTMLARLKLL